MKRAVLIALVSGLLPLAAEEKPAPQPSAAEISAFAVRSPDENSPFFLTPSLAPAALRDGRPAVRPEDAVAEYPKNRNSPDSAWAYMKGFFGGMFASVNIGPIRTAPVTSELKVDPERFPLDERRELNVTYTIRNNTSKIMRLEYPNNQRIDILTYDAEGKVVDKWSEDRTFDAAEEITIINPKERLEYQEKIPTREMKPRQTYRVDAFTTGDPNFLTQEQIFPQ